MVVGHTDTFSRISFHSISNEKGMTTRRNLQLGFKRSSLRTVSESEDEEERDVGASAMSGFAPEPDRWSSVPKRRLFVEKQVT